MNFEWKNLKWTLVYVLIFIVMCIVAHYGFWRLAHGKFFFEPPIYESSFEYTRSQLAVVKQFLIQFNSKYKRFPTNDEGLRSEEFYQIIRSDPGSLQPGLYDHFIYESLENCWVYSPSKYSGMVLAASGFFAEDFLPFVYENRRGLEPTLFSDSPVEKDCNGNYSVKVAENIYVWSIGGYLTYQDYRRILGDWKAIILQTGGMLAFLSLVMLSLYLLRYRAGAGRKPVNIIFTVIKAALGIILLAWISIRPARAARNVFLRSSCYVAGLTYHWTRPMAHSKYRETLDRYRDRGIIKPEVYDKLIAAMKKELLNQKEDEKLNRENKKHYSS